MALINCFSKACQKLHSPLQRYTCTGTQKTTFALLLQYERKQLLESSVMHHSDKLLRLLLITATSATVQSRPVVHPIHHVYLNGTTSRHNQLANLSIHSMHHLDPKYPILCISFTLSTYTCFLCYTPSEVNDYKLL